MAFIDLSVPLTEQTPVYPGDPRIKIEFAETLEENGCEDHLLTLNNHVGTHIDAPSHMLKGGKTLDQFPLDRFCGRGVYIRIPDTFTLDVVRNIKIEKDDIVLFHTGRSDNYSVEDYFTKYPAPTEKIARYLAEKQVKMVGVDTCSVDLHFTSFPIHKILLKDDILIIENLVNLSPLAGKDFTVYAFPLALQLNGSPTRVVAEIIE